MKKLLQMGVVLLLTLFIVLPAQAQTVEERLTALETDMANVQQLSFDLATLLGSLQPDLVAILTALTDQQTTIGTIQTNVSALQASQTTQNTAITSLQTKDTVHDTDITALQAKDTELMNVDEAIGKDVNELKTRFTGVTRTGSTLLLTNLNLQVVSGSGATNGSVNGRGNIIVGYNEDIFPFLGGGLPANDKTGSHNLIVGKGLNYSSYGAVVAGLDNVSSGEYASINGGNRNQATANFSSVSGGGLNTASGQNSSVSGGVRNNATGNYSSVLGGGTNTASGISSSVSGGESNTASGQSSTVSGGFLRSVDGLVDWRAGSLFEDF